MIFTNTNLITETIAIRAVRAIAAQAYPALKDTLDRAQIIQVLALACADVDQADPLYLFRTIDTTAYVGQDEPTIIVSDRNYGSNIAAIYHPAEVVDANSILFDLREDYTARLRTTITETSITVVIKWPRSIQAVALSDYPPGSLAWSDVLAVYDEDPQSIFHYGHNDDVDFSDGYRTLYFGGTAKNGIYYLHNGNLVRTSDADEAGDFVVNKYVRVTKGTQYGTTVWKCTAAPTLLNIDTISFEQYTYDSNVDAAQAAAQIIPRAAAYLALQLVPQIIDKASAAALTEWAAAILARPLPITPQAISQRIQTGTDYAAT